jgi:hypothetical protein
MNIKTTYLDTGTNKPYTGGVVQGELVVPDIKGIIVGFSNEEWKPLWDTKEYPVLFCFCDDDADVNVDTVIEVLTDEKYHEESLARGVRLKNIQLESDEVRKQRNYLLETQVDPIGPAWWDAMDNEQKDKLKKYRQDLLNIPQQEGFPFEVVWPKLF